MFQQKLRKVLRHENAKAFGLITIVIVFVYLIPPLLGRSQNPIYHKSGLASATEEGLISGQNTIDPNDGFTSQALGKHSARELLRGDLPFWNHYEGVGAPLAGGMQGASLFPLVIVQVLGNGIALFHLLLQIIAGFAAYLFFKKIRLSFRLSLAGGLLFALSGSFAWLTNAPFNPIAFLPLLMLGVEQAVQSAEKKERGGWIMIAVALSLSLYAGFPETAYLNAIFAYGWGLMRFIQINKDARKRVLPKAIVGSVVGLLLAAPILFPFLEYLSFATTGGHEGGGFANVGLPVSTIPALVMPYIFGPIFGLIKGGLPVDLFLFWSNVGGYITAPLVFGAALSMYSKRPRILRLYLSLFVTIVILKIFAFGPVKFIFNMIPGMELLAFYRYSIPVLSMALITLSLFGIEAALQKRIARKNTLILSAIFIVVVMALCLFAKTLLWQTQVPLKFHYLLLLVSLAWGVGLVVLMAVSIHKKKMHNLLIAALVLDAFVMFAVPLFSLPKTTPINMGPVKYLQENLGQNRFYTLYPIQPNYGSYFEIASINTNNLPVPKKWAEYIPEKLDSNAVPILFTGNTRERADGPTNLDEFARNIDNFADIGVKYLVSQKGAVGVEFATTNELTKVYDDKTVEIYELPVVRGYFEADNCELKYSDFNRVIADCSKPSTVLRRELYAGGWTARVNEYPTRITQEKEIFQTVALPQGKSEIDFDYTPPFIGFAYTMFAIGVAAVGYGVYQKRNNSIATKR